VLGECCVCHVEEFLAMNCKHVSIAVFAAAVMLSPCMLTAQMDSNGTLQPVGSQTYPQSPQGMNQPAGPGGSTPVTGSQVPQTSSSRDSLGAPGETGQQMLDKQFVRSAMEDGIADVKLGTLAVENGSAGVKDLAQKLVDDHSAMNKDMANVADEMGVMLPKKMSKQSQAEYERLTGLAGKDFDTEFLTYMAKMHWQTMHSFYMEASVTADPDLAAEVVKAMGMMHHHVALIASVAKDEGITLPPRPPRPVATTASK
jgi:putative membrane protein